MTGQDEQICKHEWHGGLLLRTCRERAGLSMAQLARLTGMSKAYIVRLENHPANPTVSTLYQLEEALGLRRGYLAGGPDLAPAINAETENKLAQIREIVA